MLVIAMYYQILRVFTYLLIPTVVIALRASTDSGTMCLAHNTYTGQVHAYSSNRPLAQLCYRLLRLCYATNSGQTAGELLRASTNITYIRKNVPPYHTHITPQNKVNARVYAHVHRTGPRHVYMYMCIHMYMYM